MKGKKYLILGTSFLLTLGVVLGIRGSISKLEDFVKNAPIVRTRFDIQDQERGPEAIKDYFDAEDVTKWPYMFESYKLMVDSINIFIEGYHTHDGKIGLPDLDRDGRVGEAELSD